MKINYEKYLREIEVKKITPDGREEKENSFLLKEKNFSLMVNGKLVYKFLNLDGNIRELIVGFLASEGYIHNVSDILDISISGENVSAKIKTAIDKKEEKEKAVLKKEFIFMLANKFKSDMPLHDKTYMTHSAMLMYREEIIFKCEDIGRHNAVDKMIGYALLNDIPLNECFIYMSGRLQSEAVTKAINVSLAGLISKAGATDRAVDIARKNKFLLVGRARPDSAYIFSK